MATDVVIAMTLNGNTLLAIKNGAATIGTATGKAGDIVSVQVSFANINFRVKSIFSGSTPIKIYSIGTFADGNFEAKLNPIIVNGGVYAPL